MLLIGLGAVLLLKKPSRIKIAILWGVAVLTGSLVGVFFGSANVSVFFLLVHLAQKEVNLATFFIQLVGEVLAAIIVSLLLLRQFKTNELQINNFAVIAPNSNKKSAFISEIAATFAILLVNSALAKISNTYWSIFLISCFIGLMIYTLIPISGASFNPVRDFIPRSIFAWFNKEPAEYKTNLISSNVGPLLAGVLWIIVMQVV